jgi:hypothetical protein
MLFTIFAGIAQFERDLRGALVGEEISGPSTKFNSYANFEYYKSVNTGIFQ